MSASDQRTDNRFDHISKLWSRFKSKCKGIHDLVAHGTICEMVFKSRGIAHFGNALHQNQHIIESNFGS